MKTKRYLPFSVKLCSLVLFLGFRTPTIVSAKDGDIPLKVTAGAFCSLHAEKHAKEGKGRDISTHKSDTQKLAEEEVLEDALITHVVAKSGKPYKIDKLNTGVQQLIDRNYTITHVPEYLKGASFIQTANDDKLITANDFLSFFVTKDVIVYVAYDPRAVVIPAWLGQWTKTGDTIGTSDSDVGYLDIYRKVVRNEERFYPVILGGNLAAPAAGAKTNYLVAVIESPGFQQLQAEDASLSGAVVAGNHANYTGTGFVDFRNPANDHIEWTIQIDVPGTYSLGFTYAHAGTSDRSLEITDNGSSAGLLTFGRLSSSWSAWSFLQGPALFLSRGLHKIRVTATGTSGPNIDQLSLIYLDAYFPPSIASKNMRGIPFPGTSSNASLRIYPNPFSQGTGIFYSIKEKAPVHLSIYSLQGQRLRVLENKMRNAGNYQVTFDGSGLAKGIYLYRLQAGRKVQTGKLLKE